LAAVEPSLTRIDSAVRHIRATAGRKQVSVTTFASFASMWLIPRLEQFQQAQSDVDVRIDGSEARVDLDVSDIDVALRYGPANSMPSHAVRLFGEQLTLVASPWLIQSAGQIKSLHDLAKFPLIEAGDAYSSSFLWLTWRRFLDEHGAQQLQPKRWLYFNYAHQMVQAALAGQGVVLARTPLIAQALAAKDLTEPLPKLRMDSPMSYWLIVTRRESRAGCAEVRAFADWVLEQARLTRQATGEVEMQDDLCGGD
jgi:DNA-binding transcriptional LysR family regulator